jgi:hypothetical protein
VTAVTSHQYFDTIETAVVQFSRYEISHHCIQAQRNPTIEDLFATWSSNESALCSELSTSIFEQVGKIGTL